nr:stage II sporulation protein M [Haloarchaeobius amylolyticus]
MFGAGFLLGWAASVSPGGTPFFPVREHGLTAVAADALFVHNATIALAMAAGGLLFGLPVVGLLSFNGFVLGSVTAGIVDARGLVETVALLAPHGVVELSALWLAGAVGLRWTHVVWRTARGDRHETGLVTLAGESVGWVVLVLALLAVAAVVEASVTPWVARVVT